MTLFRQRWLAEGTIFLTLFFGVLFLQWKSGALDSELFGYPDEAAHYVTSVMIHQYITEGGLQNPIGYAEDYYLHYPKVAIGHWPPAFYVVTSIWMLFAGVSIKGVLILQAVLVAIMGWLLFRSLRDEVGFMLAGTASAIWIFMPVTQSTYMLVMAEFLLAVASFLAAITFAGYLRTKRSWPLFLFAFWTFVAAMTKGSGFALFALPPVAILFAENRWILKDRRLYATVALCMAALVPWQVWSSRMVSNGMDIRGVTPVVITEQVVAAVQQFVPLFSPLLAVLGVLGIAAFLLRWPEKWTDKISRPFWVCQLGLIAGTYALHIISPNGIEFRRILMAVPSFLAFSCLSMFCISNLVPAKYPVRALIPAGVFAIYVLIFGQTAAKHPLGWRSFIATSLSHYTPGTPVLIAGGTEAENVVISESAQISPTPRDYLLRSSKLLADSDWSGEDYKPRASNLAEVATLLAQVPVNVIAIEDEPPLSKQARVRLQHWLMIHDLVRKNPQDWKEVASGAVSAVNGSPSRVRVYERQQPILTAPHVQVDMDHSLGRTIEGN